MYTQSNQVFRAPQGCHQPTVPNNSLDGDEKANNDKTTNFDGRHWEFLDIEFPQINKNFKSHELRSQNQDHEQQWNEI